MSIRRNKGATTRMWGYLGACAAVVCGVVYKFTQVRSSSHGQCDETVVVFTRYPQPGTTKTRLIPFLGEKAACLAQLVMSNQLLARLGTLQSLRPGVQVEVQYYGGSEKQVAYWLQRKSSFLHPFQWRPQEGSNLGDKMKNALARHLMLKTKRVVLVGCDIPGITADVVAEALDKLKQADTDMVLGKAEDGGYYLVGLNQGAVRQLSSLFVGMDWGTDHVLDQQLGCARALGVRPSLLSSTLMDVDTPEDLDAFESGTGLSPETLRTPRMSVVIPVLNEEKTIETALTTVVQNSENPALLEVVVVDGGSSDNTLNKLASLTDLMAKHKVNFKVIQSEKGRGRQLHSGAMAASGQYLVFLHSDSRLPPSYDAKVKSCLAVPGNVAGAFRFGLDVLHSEELGKECGRLFLWQLSVVEWATNRRAQSIELPYGDQAFFMSRQVYGEVGGFPDWPLMEDINMVEKLQKLGHVTLVDGEPCITSARRWQKHGVFKITGLNVLLASLYKLGVSPHTLGQWYYGQSKSKQK